MGVAIVDHYGYVADWGSGLQVIDVAEPESPLIVGSIDTPGNASNVTLVGDHAYVTDGVSGLQIIDVANPANPVIVGSIDTPGNAMDVASVNNYVFVADGASGLQEFDVSEPQNPRFVAEVDTPGITRGISVLGDRVYLVDGNAGIIVLDISNPENPMFEGYLDTPGDAYQAARQGNFLYVADWYKGLQVIDITDTWNMHIVSSLYLRAAASDVTVVGTHAYVASQKDGLLVVDISNPRRPRITGNADTQGFANGVAVAGEYVYLADQGSGLAILPSQCPGTTAVELSSFDVTPLGEAILVQWSTAFEGYHLGFQIQRSTRAEEGYAQVTSTLIEPPGPYRFMDSGVKPGITYFYRLEAIDRAGGIEHFGPRAARVESADASIGLRNFLWPSHPNPFGLAGEQAELRFSLAQRTSTTVRIFDAAGRQVRVLMDSELEEGTHSASWDGRNDAGSMVGAGVYFCRLETPEFSAVRTLIRFR